MLNKKSWFLIILLSGIITAITPFESKANQAPGMCVCNTLPAMSEIPTLTPEYINNATTKAQCDKTKTDKEQADPGSISSCYFFENSSGSTPWKQSGTTILIKTNAQCKHFSNCNPSNISGGKGECFDEACWMNDKAYNAWTKEADPLTTSIVRDLNIKKPLLEFRLPGLKFTDVKNTIDSEGYIHLPYIGEFLLATYKYGLSVASIVAVIMVIVSGFRIVMSAGGEEKAEGYKRIGQSIIGLAILWGSYAIMYNINPQLVQFKVLKIKYIEPVPMPEEDENIPDGQYPTLANVTEPTWTYETFDCSKKNTYQAMGVVPMSGILRYTCPGIEGDIYTIPEMKDPLCKAASLAQQHGYTMRINEGGSYRSFKTQVDLWCGTKAAKYNPVERKKFFAVPGRSNHGHGRAVDLFLAKKGNQLFHADPKEQCKVEPKIIEEMGNFFYTDPKFKRLETEIWHFEYDTNTLLLRDHYLAKPRACANI